MTLLAHWLTGSIAHWLTVTQDIADTYTAFTNMLDSRINVVLEQQRLMQPLRANGRPCITIFTADHGWSLSENKHYKKYVPFRASARVPLIMHDSRLEDMGVPPKHHMFPRSTIDIFPTLVDLVTKPGADLTDFSGHSLKSVLECDSRTSSCGKESSKEDFAVVAYDDSTMVSAAYR